MTVRAPIIGTNTDSAETFRLAMCGLWAPASALNARTGVTSTPTLTGTGNFTATVGPFTCIIDGTSNSLQGSYPVANDIASTVTIGAANTQARIDLISMQIQDNAYDGSGFSRGQLVVTAGTPSGSPVAPSTPANAIALWQVPVGANATSITWASATAVFPYAAAAGGIVPVRNSTDKPSAASGVQYRHRLDVTLGGGATSALECSTDGTNYYPVYDNSVVPAATTAAINAAVAFGTWTNLTPATGWTSAGAPAQYRAALGGRWELRGSLSTTTTVTNSSNMWTGGPSPSIARDLGLISNNSTTIGTIHIPNSGGTASFSTNNGTNIGGGTSFSLDGLYFT